jgi:lysophospholipase L1-like esterase
VSAALLLRQGVACLCLAAGPALAQSAWVTTWTASPQPTWGADFAFPTNVPPALDDQTMRQVARISVGGQRVRVVLSNDYGHDPLTIGAVRIALAGAGSEIAEGGGRRVLFGGEPSVTLPPGAPAVSDAIDLEVPPLARLAISVWVPGRTVSSTFHWDGRSTAWIVAGDRTAEHRLDAATATVTSARLFLSALQVETAAPVGSVIAIGDSITDGNGATLDADTRWPDFLAARLAPANLAMLNAGISGARLLQDRMGVNALARFDRDVLSQPGVRSVIVLLGINDIAWPGTAFDPQGRPPTLASLQAAYGQLVARARTHGVRAIGATLPPFEGALHGTPLENYHDAAKDALRRQLNAWIRDGGAFDAVVDLDALLRDPSRPARLRPEFDSGDHLHPGDRGNQAIADAVADTLLRTGSR